MVRSDLSRRSILTGALASLLAAQAVRAEEIIDLNWNDLLPEEEASLPDIARDLIQRHEGNMSSPQPQSTAVRTDWNGKVVRISGFVVPVEYDGTGVTAFLLVPYVGACVHVPPPPANQLVFVTTQTPYLAKGLFESVTVVGLFGAASVSTQLAQIGYALSADKIEPYS